MHPQPSHMKGGLLTNGIGEQMARDDHEKYLFYLGGGSFESLLTVDLFPTASKERGESIHLCVRERGRTLEGITCKGRSCGYRGEELEESLLKDFPSD